MPTEDFFAERKDQSQIKTEIVRKYFWAWAKIIAKQVRKRGHTKLGYVDLFAGPGAYSDGTKSTPILILEGAIRDKEIVEMLVASFNDEKKENSAKLKAEIEKIPGIKTLRFPPRVSSDIVDDSIALQFENKPTIPTLFFIDPWGYKGLSVRLVRAVIQSWGCDCMFFFNYNRINAALSNSVMTSNMDSFFGMNRANELRKAIDGKAPEEREKLIIDGLKTALLQQGGKFCVEYFFKDDHGSKTSHFLIFVRMCWGTT